MSDTPSRTHDLRFARADYDALGWALAVSIILHLLAYTGYQAARKYHWLENLHLPAWLQKARPTLVVIPPVTARQQPPPPAEAPLMFVEVNPALAIAEAPKKAKYYSDKSSRAANPHADLETDSPKITGEQEHVMKTEDVPRTKAFPLQPSAPPTPKAEAAAEEAKPATAAPAPGQLLIAKAEPRPAPTTTPAKTAEQKSKPRTVAEAKARQQSLAGQKARLEGGVAAFNLESTLDVAATPFGAYDAAIIAAIQTRWYTLIDAQQLTRGVGRVSIAFRLHDDGRITDLVMEENSVGELLGVLCERAIRDPSPFAPWPSDMRRLVGANYREVKFTFYYN